MTQIKMPLDTELKIYSQIGMGLGKIVKLVIEEGCKFKKKSLPWERVEFGKASIHGRKED